MIFRVVPIVDPVFIKADSEADAKREFSDRFGTPDSFDIEEVDEVIYKEHVIND